MAPASDSGIYAIFHGCFLRSPAGGSSPRRVDDPAGRLIECPRLHVKPAFPAVGLEVSAALALVFGWDAKALCYISIIDKRAAAMTVLAPVRCAVKQGFFQQFRGVCHVHILPAVLYVLLQAVQQFGGVHLDAVIPCAAGGLALDGLADFLNCCQLNFLLVMEGGPLRLLLFPAGCVIVEAARWQALTASVWALDSRLLVQGWAAIFFTAWGWLPG